MNPRTSRTHDATRHGSAYLLVLGGCLLLVTAGMSAIYASGVRKASGELQVEAWKSRLAAEAGIEAALDDIHVTAGWRSSKTSGNWYTNRTMGDGTFSVDVIDTIDGNFTNNPSDPVDVVSTGIAGRGGTKLKVTLNSSPVPLSCLGAVLCSGGLVTNTASTINSNQLIHSNAGVTSVLANVSGNVDAVLTVLGLTYTGTTRSLVASRSFPAAGSLTYYSGVATPIAKGSLNRIGQNYYLEQVVLSPASNPYGATNSMGIYIIDGGGDDIIIRNCRIVGTVIVVNGGNGSQVRGSVNMGPAVPNYPVLLFDGNIELRFDSTSNLSEAGEIPNFNPAGTPYASVTDSDKADSYPSEMRGLVYIRGNMTTSQHPKIIGNLICTGAVTTTGSLTLSYTTTCFSAPPPGFAESPIPMKAVAGSWQQLVD